MYSHSGSWRASIRTDSGIAWDLCSRERARWRDEGDTAGYRQVWKETEGWGVVTAAAQRPWAESLGSRPCAPNHSGSAVTKWRRIKKAIGITHTALSEVQRPLVVKDNKAGQLTLTRGKAGPSSRSSSHFAYA